MYYVIKTVYHFEDPLCIKREFAESIDEIVLCKTLIECDYTALSDLEQYANKLIDVAIKNFKVRIEKECFVSDIKLYKSYLPGGIIRFNLIGNDAIYMDLSFIKLSKRL